MHQDRLFQGRRVTQTQSSVKAFCKAGYAQMNDWSRLAVDPTGRKNSRPKNELHEYKYALDKGAKGARPIRKRELGNNASGGRTARTTPFVLDKYLS
jgi:hypothetical protein